MNKPRFNKIRRYAAVAIIVIVAWALGYRFGYREGYNSALDTVASKIETASLSVIQRLDSIARDIRALKLR